MLEFKEISLDDKDRADALIKESNLQGAEYCFTALYIWRMVYKTAFCFYKDFLFVRSFTNHGGQIHLNYLYPVGHGNLEEAIELLRQDAIRLNVKFNIGGIFKEQKEILTNLFPNKFDFKLERDISDYIYSASDLISLKGKKFQSKRNHASKFKALDNWEYQQITKENTQECLQMNTKWCKMHNCIQNLSLNSESCSVKEALKNFDVLKLRGGLLRLHGEILAFSIGEMLNNNTFLVHIEKAFPDIRGAYPTISQEFLSHQQDLNFQFVNREDDAGDQGLRTAKMQYNPLYILEKWKAFEKLSNN